MSSGKKYGLIIPAKKKGGGRPVAKPSVFDDSSSDEEVRPACTKKLKKKVNVCSADSVVWYQEYWIWMLKYYKYIYMHIYIKCIILLQDSGGKKGFKSSFWQENKKRARQVEVRIHASDLFSRLVIIYVRHVILHHPESWVSCEGTCWGSLCVWIWQHLRWPPGKEKEVRPSTTKERHQGMCW